MLDKKFFIVRRLNFEDMTWTHVWTMCKFSIFENEEWLWNISFSLITTNNEQTLEFNSVNSKIFLPKAAPKVIIELLKHICNLFCVFFFNNLRSRHCFHFQKNTEYNCNYDKFKNSISIILCKNWNFVFFVCHCSFHSVVKLCNNGRSMDKIFVTAELYWIVLGLGWFVSEFFKFYLVLMIFQKSVNMLDQEL